MLDIVYIDKKPRVFYNFCYVGFLDSTNWFYVINQKYANECRNILRKDFFPTLNVYWQGRTVFGRNFDIYD